MKQYQLQFQDHTKFRSDLEKIRLESKGSNHGDIFFYLTWSKGQDDTLDGVISQIEASFPEAKYYGNEACGNISNGKLTYGINVNCSIFEDRDNSIELVWINDQSEINSLDGLWDYCKQKNKLRGVELISTTSYINKIGLEGNISTLDKDIVIFGGASAHFDSTIRNADIIASSYGRTSDGLVAVLYQGNMQLSSNYILGWKGIGSYKEVTSTIEGRIGTINGQAASQLYARYLNITSEHDIFYAFPLIMDKDGLDFVMTPCIYPKDNSLKTVTEVPVGTLLRIAYGNKNTMLEELYSKIQTVIKFQPEAIKLYSCVGRKFFWGENEIDRENTPLNNLAPCFGSFTGSELLRFGDKLRVLNMTLCFVSIKESTKTPVSISNITRDSEDKSIDARLAHLMEIVSEEQAKAYQQLHENTEIISGLASEYRSLFYINLDKDFIKPYAIDSTDPKYREHYNHIKTGEHGGVFSILDKFVSAAKIHPEDKQIFSGLNKESLIERLKGVKKISIRFRVDYGEGYKWSVMDVIKSEAPSEDANVVMIGFAEKDKEIRNEQERMRQYEMACDAAEAANKAKSTFLFNMSHDIRTPMNAILGYTDIALRHTDDSIKVIDCLKKIKASGGHLLNLINDILEMSRIESGKMELKRDAMDIRETIRNTEHMGQVLSIPKSINFKVEVGEIRNPYVFADELHLNEVIINVITNAVKYSHEGGSVKYEVEQIGDPVDGEVMFRFRVTDKGVGMSEDFLEHIYDTFSREHTSSASGNEGSGLGMSIVKRIIDMTKGSIDIKSKVGKGTVVTIQLPLQVLDEETFNSFKEEAHQTNDVKADALFHGKRVLLVEDNPLNREIAKVILTEAGFVVETAEDGDIAVKMVAEKESLYYDYILMDIQMPIMNGYEATKAIRKLPGGDAIPIIAVSANAFKEDRERSMKAGMDDHVAKPIDIAELFDTMKLLT